MMKEILITSSALILALLVIRQVFKEVLSRRVQYALWGLVLVRLLVPVSLPAAGFSVMTAARPVQNVVDQRLERIVPGVPAQLPAAQPTGEQPVQPLSPDITKDSVQYEGPFLQLMEPGQLPPANNLTLGEVLALVWKVGMVLMGAFFLLSNTAFYLRLRKNRREWTGTAHPCEGKRKVYLVPEGVIPSPCLFGRSIYLTPAVASDPHKLRHVLTHEETHAKHLDPLWSLLRCVCLTLYWFDPLVWVAASCSKADCELACDESALMALGESQRIPYGQTLLSLIPVKRPSNPMLAATTMTAGKKQLKDRVKRIANRPRQLMAAALAVAVLAGIASACTFTGGKPSPSETEAQALSGTQLLWFNAQFFNSGGAAQDTLHSSGPAGDTYYNLRNQFANGGFNPYEKPEDIDLFQLFYCEPGESFSDAELKTAFGYDTWEDLPCPAYKLSAAGMDAILQNYTGLTVEETNKVGLDQFTYLPEYDAYYWMHGDTNYPGDIQFTTGSREGAIIRLYHSSGSQWYCITLEEQADTADPDFEGVRFHFLSNLPCEKPAIPAPIPARDPVETVSLKNLTPYEAPALTITQAPQGDFDDHYENRLENWSFDGHNAVVYRSVLDGRIKAAIRRENGQMDVFLDPAALESESITLAPYYDLFGHSGFALTYQVRETGTLEDYRTDFFYLTESGDPVLLLRSISVPDLSLSQLDLNGDGTDEFVTGRALFFLRRGKLYKADLPALLKGKLPENTTFFPIDPYSRCYVVRGSGMKDWKRYIYFNGEALLLYQEEKPTTDHMVNGITQNVPAEVVSKAREYAQSVYEDKTDYEGMGTLDDWRVERFYGPYSTQVGDITVEAWAFNYECHTTTPEEVVLAGGRYLTEDNWVSPGYPGCDWLFFQRTADNSLVFLWQAMNNDMSPDSYAYGQYLEKRLAELNFDLGSTTFAALDAARKLEYIMDHSDGQVTLILTPPGEQGIAYTVSPDSGNGRYYQRCFSDSQQYLWQYVDSVPDTPEGTSLTITDPTWDFFIRLWEGTDLVMIKESNQGALWYTAELTGLPEDDVFYGSSRIFPFMRGWFDEVEASRHLDTALADHGDGPRDTALAYLTLYEGGKSALTEGNRYKCSFTKITDLNCEPDPNDPGRFSFSYSLIFVPEKAADIVWHMPGNTAEYEGADPEVPQGAYQYWRRGQMVLRDGYWHCESLGTG